MGNPAPQASLLAKPLAALLAFYCWFCLKTTRWQVEGRDELARDLTANGPVILLLWHGRLLLGPGHWPRHAGRLSSLRDPSPAGEVSAAFQEWFKLEPIRMKPRQSDLGTARDVLKALKSDVSLALTPDGPRGPFGKFRPAALDWIRVSQRPIWVYAFAVRRGRHLKSWDRLLVPLPFTRGVVLYRRVMLDLPRHASAEAMDAARVQLSSVLDQVLAEVDAKVT